MSAHPFLCAAPELPWSRLLWLLVPLAACYAVFFAHRLRERRRLLVGALRATVQLAAIGYVLVPLFALGATPLTPVAMGLMCFFAAVMSLGVLGKARSLRLLPLALAAILPTVLGLVLPAVAVLLPEVSAFSMRHALGLAGMLAGSAMNAVSLAADRFVTGLEQRRGLVEAAFAHGATATEAARPLARDALRAAVTPGLNAMIAVGLVSLPGMMTGQLMAGQDPLGAARYQLAVMILWTASATLAPALFLRLLAGTLLRGHRAVDAPLGVAERRVFQKTLAPIPLGSGPLSRDERPPEGPSTFGEGPR